MAHLTIEIPKCKPGQDADATTREYLESAVATWYDRGLVSQSRGAEILGMHREEFLLMLGKYGVAAIQVDPKDFDAELNP